MKIKEYDFANPDTITADDISDIRLLMAQMSEIELVEFMSMIGKVTPLNDLTVITNLLAGGMVDKFVSAVRNTEVLEKE